MMKKEMLFAMFVVGFAATNVMAMERQRELQREIQQRELKKEIPKYLINMYRYPSNQLRIDADVFGLNEALIFVLDKNDNVDKMTTFKDALSKEDNGKTFDRLDRYGYIQCNWPNSDHVPMVVVFDKDADANESNKRKENTEACAKIKSFYNEYLKTKHDMTK